MSLLDPDDDELDDSSSQDSKSHDSGDESTDGLSPWLIAGGVAGFVLLCVSVSLYFGWPYNPWPTVRETLADPGVSILKRQVQRTSLTEDQEKTVNEQLELLKEKYIQGDITSAQLWTLGDLIYTRIKERSYLEIGIIDRVERKVITDSNFSTEEKVKARRTFEGAQRALYQGKLSKDFADTATDPLYERDGAGDFRVNLRDDDYRRVVGTFREKLKGLDVSEDRFELNIADEFEQMTQQIVSGKAAAK